jgi:hypothetical protein
MKEVYYKKTIRVFYLLTQDSLLGNHRMLIAVHFRGLGAGTVIAYIQIASHSPYLRPIGSDSVLLTRELNNASLHLIAGVWGKLFPPAVGCGGCCHPPQIYKQSPKHCQPFPHRVLLYIGVKPSLSTLSNIPPLWIINKHIVSECAKEFITMIKTLAHPPSN